MVTPLLGHCLKFVGHEFCVSVVLVTPGPCLPLLALVDHHTLMRNFFTWWNKEMAVRGFCPGNWKWLITPLSPTTTDCYLGLNKMTEYTIKPVSSSLRQTCSTCSLGC